jgi:serine/threonine protein kinase
MSQTFNRFIDEYQNVHFKDKVLGKGGQGVVFRTKDPDLAIKLVTDESGVPLTDKSSVEKYSLRFKRFRLLPLPERLNISVPVALLQNNAGYVMQLLSDMVPLSYFWLNGKAVEQISSRNIPEWLMPEDENEKKRILENPDNLKPLKELIHYCGTGGLRRRLIVLYKTASLLARLHGNGLVYGDISPNNIFISKDIEHSSVWLIDADNIRFEISEGGSVVYTPRYGAPELVQGKDGGRPASDCHAFAVVAFYLLSLIHPFIGKKVDGTDEGDWADNENDDEDIEEKAYAGHFPWVDDQKDDSNSSEKGLPRSLILTDKLKILFERTFSEGRKSPFLRPTIYHWPEALAQAADITILCPGCNMTYYYDFIHPETGRHSCPYCKTLRPQMLMLESYRWKGPDEVLDAPCWRFVREIIDGSKVTIPKRVFDEFTMVDSDTKEMIISVSEKDVFINRLENCKADLYVAVDTHQKNGFQKVYSQIKINREVQNFHFWMFVAGNSPRLVLCSISEGTK